MALHISSNFPSKYWKRAEKYKCSEARCSISIYLWCTVRPINDGRAGSQLLTGRDRKISNRGCNSL